MATLEELQSLAEDDAPPSTFTDGDIVAAQQTDVTEFFKGGVFSFSQEERDRLAAKGKMGPLEAAARVDLTEALIPFNPEGALRVYELTRSLDRNRLNEYAPEDPQRDIDLTRIKDYFRNIEEMRIRGVNMGGKFTSGAISMIGPAIEFALAGGLISVAKGAAKKSALVLAEELAKRQALSYTTRAVKGVGVLAATAITRTAITPQRGVQEFNERRINKGVELTDKGIKILPEITEKPATAIFKAAGAVLITNFAESLGGTVPFGELAGAAGKRLAGTAIGKVGASVGAATGKIKKSIRNAIPARLVSLAAGVFTKIHPNLTADKLFTSLGVSSFAEELGEEQVERLLKAAAGITDFGVNGGNVFDRMLASTPSMEDFLVEVGLVGFMQAGHFSTAQTLNILQERRKESGRDKTDLPKDNRTADAIINKIASNVIEEQVNSDLKSESPENKFLNASVLIDVPPGELTLKGKITLNLLAGDTTLDENIQETARLRLEKEATFRSVAPIQKRVAVAKEQGAAAEERAIQSAEKKLVALKTLARDEDIATDIKTGVASERALTLAEKKAGANVAKAEQRLSTAEKSAEGKITKEVKKAEEALRQLEDRLEEQQVLADIAAEKASEGVTVSAEKKLQTIENQEKRKLAQAEKEAIESEERIIKAQKLNRAVQGRVNKLKSDGAAEVKNIKDLSAKRERVFATGGSFVGISQQIDKAIGRLLEINKEKLEIAIAREGATDIDLGSKSVQLRADTVAKLEKEIFDSKLASLEKALVDKDGLAEVRQSAVVTNLQATLNGISKIIDEKRKSIENLFKEKQKESLQRLEKERARIEQQLKNEQATIEKAAEIKQKEIVATLEAELRNVKKTAKNARRNTANLSELKQKGVLSTLAQQKRSIQREIAAKQRGLEIGFREGTLAAKKEIGAVQSVLTQIINKSGLTDTQKKRFLSLVRNIQTKVQLEIEAPVLRGLFRELQDANLVRDAKVNIQKLVKKGRAKKINGIRRGRVSSEVGRIFRQIQDIIRMEKEDAKAVYQKNVDFINDVSKKKSLGESVDVDISAELIAGTQVLGVYAGLTKGSEAQKVLESVERLLARGRSDLKEQIDARLKGNRDAVGMIVRVITGGKGLDKFRINPPKAHEAASRWDILTSTVTVSNGLRDILEALSANDPSGRFESDLVKFGNTFQQITEEKRGRLDNTDLVFDLAVTAYHLKDRSEVFKKFQENEATEDIGSFEVTLDNKAEVIKELELRLRDLNPRLNKNEVKEIQAQIGKVKKQTEADAVVSFRSEVRVLNLSKDEALSIYMQLLDPTLVDTYTETMKYTPEMITAIRNWLTPEDRKYAEGLLKFYDGYYDSINDVYKKEFFVDLEYNANHSPIQREGVNSEEINGVNQMLEEIKFRAVGLPSSLKSRTKNLHPIRRVGASRTVTNHIRAMEHFKAWAEKLRQLKTALNSKESREVILTHFGPKALGHINFILDNEARGRIEMTKLERDFDKWRSNYNTVVLGGRLVQMFKQFSSIVVMSETMPIRHQQHFALGVLDFIKNPFTIKKKYQFLKTHPYFNDRRRNLNFDRALRHAIESQWMQAYRTKPSLQSLQMLMVATGDSGPIVFGGWSLFRYHHKVLGKSEAEALDAAMEIVSNTQQTSETTQQAVAQQQGTVFSMMFSQFKGGSIQYFNLELAAWRALLRGKGSTADNVKAIAIMHFVMPMVWQAMVDVGWDEEHQRRAAVWGSLNGFLIWGDFGKILFNAINGDRWFKDQEIINSVAEDIARAGKIFRDDGITYDNFLDLVKLLGNAHGVAFTGVAVGNIIETLEGFSDVLNEKLGGGLRALGLTPFQVREVLKRDKR